MSIPEKQSLYHELLSMQKTVHLDSEDDRNIQQLRNYFYIHQPVRLSAKDFIRVVFENTDYYACLFVKKKEGEGGSFNKFLGLKSQVCNVIHRYEEQKDIYISYSSYVSKKNKDANGNKIETRIIENIRHTVCFVQDLDYYKEGISEEQALEKLSNLIEAKELEMPHIILFTGNGIQLVWLIDNVHMKRNSKTYNAWKAIQNYKLKVLEGLQSDSVVKNANAVTRLPNSINSKNEKKVRAYLLRDDRLTLGYFLENYDLFPSPDRKVKPRKCTGKVVTNTKGWNQFTLNRERENDIFRIVEYKESHNENLAGIRQHMALVLRFHALVSSGGDYGYAEQQVINLWGIIQQREATNLHEILRRSQVAERYYREWTGELKWLGSGKYKQPGLFYRNQTLIHFWKISKECQLELKTIKVRDKEYERVKSEIYRRKKGSADRATYLAIKRQKREDKLVLLQKLMQDNPEATNVKLGDMLGISEGYVRKLKGKLNRTSTSH